MIPSGLFPQYPPQRQQLILAYRALCFHHNVVKAPVDAGYPLSQTLEMELIQRAQIPTHVLALSRLQRSSTTSQSYPLMVPIQAGRWAAKMTTLLPPSPLGSTLPVPRWDTTR